MGFGMNSVPFLSMTDNAKRKLSHALLLALVIQCVLRGVGAVLAQTGSALRTIPGTNTQREGIRVRRGGGEAHERL